MRLSVRLRYWYGRLKQILGIQKHICWVGTESEYAILPLSFQRKNIFFYVVHDGVTKINEELNKININK